MSLSETGDVYTWGWNESGQLALPTRSLAEDRETVTGKSESQLLIFALFCHSRLLDIGWPATLQCLEGTCDILGTLGYSTGAPSGRDCGKTDAQHLLGMEGLGALAWELESIVLHRAGALVCAAQGQFITVVVIVTLTASLKPQDWMNMVLK